MNNIESGWSDHLLGPLLVTMVTLLVTGSYGMGRTPAAPSGAFFMLSERTHATYSRFTAIPYKSDNVGINTTERARQRQT